MKIIFVINLFLANEVFANSDDCIDVLTGSVDGSVLLAMHKKGNNNSVEYAIRGIAEIALAKGLSREMLRSVDVGNYDKFKELADLLDDMKNHRVRWIVADDIKQILIDAINLHDYLAVEMILESRIATMNSDSLVVYLSTAIKGAMKRKNNNDNNADLYYIVTLLLNEVRSWSYGTNNAGDRLNSGQTARAERKIVIDKAIREIGFSWFFADKKLKELVKSYID